MERLFSYGTLRDADVQQEVFGRIISGTPDAMVDYGMSSIVVEGKPYRLAVPEQGSAVEGRVMDMTPEDLTAADAFETSAYRRERVTLRSGAVAWAYVRA